MAAAVVADTASVNFHGKEVTLWTTRQLENLNQKVLRARALDLRDLIGEQQLPRVPYHAEQIILWILGVQDSLQSFENPENMQAMIPAQGAHSPNPAQMEPAYQGQMRGGDTSDAANDAYVEGRGVADACRERSRGTTGLLSWD